MLSPNAIKYLSTFTQGNVLDLFDFVIKKYVCKSQSM